MSDPVLKPSVPTAFTPPPGKKSRVWLWVLGVICAIPLLTFLGCVAFMGVVGRAFSEAAVEVANNHALEKVSFDPNGFVMQRTGMVSEISGTITNKTDTPISYLQVTFALYDASGAQVGTAWDNISDLQPHTDWKVKAQTFNSDAEKFKLIEITDTTVTIEKK